MNVPNYPLEELDPDYDNGTMPDNVATLADAIVGHRIVSATKETITPVRYHWGSSEATVITLDNGKRVLLRNTNDCCAYTYLDKFLLHPENIDHIIMGVGTTDGYLKWHIYADFGDIMELEVGWSSGNPFFYGYGFDIEVLEGDAP